MIKLKNLTPEVYYKQSRDFQLLGRLFDVVLNSVKTEADLIYNIPLSDGSNEKLLDLMALTLGFKPSSKYNTKQLAAICKVFPEIIKNKGSIKSIVIACNALFNAEGAEQALDYDFKGESHTELNLYIPQEFGDITILNDLLSYILPAGMSCNIIREYIIRKTAFTEIGIKDIFMLYSRGDASASSITGSPTEPILYDNNKLALIPRIVTGDETPTDRAKNILRTSDINTGNIKDNAGFLGNSVLFYPQDLNENRVEDSLEEGIPNE